MAERGSKSPMRRSLSLIRPDVAPHSGMILIGTFALLFEVAFRVLEPWPMKIVVDAVSVSLPPRMSGASRSAALLYQTPTAPTR